jgi:hypothetical protein
MKYIDEKGKIRKSKFTYREFKLVMMIRDHILSFIDGKPHGYANGCLKPVGNDIYLETWILNNVQLLLDHMKTGKKL